MTIDALPRTGASTAAAASKLTTQSRPSAQIEKKPSPFVQFEAFVLQNFVQSIMPSEASEFFGEGTAGEVWKSMLAEKIAMQVAQAGGVGIAKMIAPKDGATATLPATGAAPLKSSSADRLLEMQAGAATTASLAALAAPGASATGKSSIGD